MMTDSMNFIAEVAIVVEVDDMDVFRHLEGNMTHEEKIEIVSNALVNQEWGELMINNARVVGP